MSFRTSGGTLTKQVQYTYDVFDRLIGKAVDDDGDGIFDRSARFVYDGDDVVLSFDGTGSLTHRYLHGDDVDQVFASEDALGEVLWALTDYQGTVRDVADYDVPTDALTFVNQRTFDSFGNITSESNPSVDFRYAWTGRFFDADTGLQYNRGRWYDPTVGRWISEDPIGFGAGDANLNRYVGNSPTNGTDPSGLIDHSAPFGGGWANPLNYLHETVYHATKWYYDLKYDNHRRTPDLGGKQAELEVRLQSRDSRCEDDLRRSIRRQRQRPIPRIWAETIQSLEVFAAGTYVNAFNFIKPHSLNGAFTDYSYQLRRRDSNARQSLQRVMKPDKAIERAHHIIPLKFKKHPVVRAAARGGFNMNGKNNGINLCLKVHPQGSFHPRYSNAIENILERWKDQQLTPRQAAAALQGLADRLRPGLERLNQKGQRLR